MPKINPRLLKTEEPFQLFATSETVRQAILADMKTRGYDSAFPVVVWNKVIVDGHTRVSVAKQLGIDVEYVDKNFNSLTGALHYAVHCQKDRRNVSLEALLKAVEAIDVEEKKAAQERQKEFGKQTVRTDLGKQPLRSKERNITKGESAEKTGEVLGISSTQVKRVRVINDPRTPDEIKEKVKAGEYSISKGAELARESRKPKQEEEVQHVEQVTIPGLTRDKEPKFLGQVERALERGERFLHTGFLYEEEIQMMARFQSVLQGLCAQANMTLTSKKRRIDEISTKGAN